MPKGFSSTAATPIPATMSYRSCCLAEWLSEMQVDEHSMAGRLAGFRKPRSRRAVPSRGSPRTKQPGKRASVGHAADARAFGKASLKRAGREDILFGRKEARA